MPGGPAEWLVVLAIVLLLFGAKKLPDLAGSLGKSIKEFRKGAAEPGDDDQDHEPSATGDHDRERSATGDQES